MMLFQLDTEAVIINEVVINEVRLRECLWNPRNMYYKNKTEKYKAWEEVSIAVLPKYTTFSEDNKQRIVRAVQSRWKTARDAYMKCRLTGIKKPTYKARQHRFIYNKLRFLERARDLFEDIDEDVKNRVKIPTHCAGGNTAGIAGLAAGQAKVCPDFVTKEPPNKGVPLVKIRQSVPPALCVALKGPTYSASCSAASLAAGQAVVCPVYLTKEAPYKGVPLGKSERSVPPAMCVAFKGPTHSAGSNAAGQAAVRPACHIKESPNKGVPLGKSGMCVVFKDEEDSNSFVGDNSESQSMAFKGPTHSAGGTAAGQAAVRPACHTKEPPNKGVPLGKSGMRVVIKEEEGSNSFVDDNSESQSIAFEGPKDSHTKEPPNKGVPLGKSGMRVIFKDEEVSNSFVGDNYESQSIAFKAPTHSAGGNAAGAAVVEDAMRTTCHTKEQPNKGVPPGKSGMRAVFKYEEGSNSFVGDNSESQSIAFKGPTHSAGGNAASAAVVQDAMRTACHTKEQPNKGVPPGKSGMRAVFKYKEGSNSFVGDNSESQSIAFKGPTHSTGGNAAGAAAVQNAMRMACHTKEQPNKGVPPGKSSMRAVFKYEEGSNSFIGDNSESQSIAFKGPIHSAGGNAAVQDAIRTACHTKEQPNKGVPPGKSGMRAVFKYKEGSNSFVGDNSVSQSIAFKGPSHSAGGNAAGTAAVQNAVRPACHAMEPPNKGVPLGISGMSVGFKDNEKGSNRSNSFVGDNSQSQSTSTVYDDDMNVRSDEMMDFDIDTHDDFKENIKHLVTAFDGIDDKAVNDKIKQECLPGTSSQNNYQQDPLATANVTKPPKNSTSAKTSALESDDLLFFNSLAPLIVNFDMYQKLILRSKIMEVVNEVGKIGPVKIKQERET